MTSSFPWRALLGFSALPILAAAAPLLILPVLTRTIGAEGWTHVAIGMSVGGAGAIVVNYGWGVVGPAQAAILDHAGATRLYRTSFFMRAVLSAVVAPVSYVAATLLAHDYSGGAGVMAIAYAVGGLSPAWYLIGRSQPVGVAVWDTVPRLIAALIAVPVLLIFPSALAFAVTTLAIYAAAWLWFGGRSMREGGPIDWTIERATVGDAFRKQSSLVASSVVAGLYTSLSVALVGLANLPAVAGFAAVDRVRAMGKQGEMAVANGFQGWVGSAARGSDRGIARARKALGVTSAAGVVAGALLAYGLPPLAPFLFGGEITVSSYLALFMGLSLVATAISISTTFHVLAPAGKTRVISVATLAGAAVGAPTVLLGAASFGAVGAAAGVFLAEAVVVLVELPVALAILRRSR